MIFQSRVEKPLRTRHRINSHVQTVVRNTQEKSVIVKIITGPHLNWGVKEGHSEEVKAYGKLLGAGRENGMCC